MTNFEVHPRLGPRAQVPTAAGDFFDMVDIDGNGLLDLDEARRPGVETAMTRLRKIIRRSERRCTSP